MSRKRAYVSVSLGSAATAPAASPRGAVRRAVCSAAPAPQGEGPWRTCPRCRTAFEEAALDAPRGACPSCGALFRLSAAERIAAVADRGSFEEWDALIPPCDPLVFPGYQEKLADQRERTGLAEAVRCGRATLGGLPVALGVMDSGFMMGSMGSVVGEKITRLVERATAERLPAIIFTASGGARMQEGLASLMQMAKVSAALERHGAAGLPYFAVLTDPTTGGVTASFAMLGDVILAEPGALIGFAGQRVIRDTIKQELPAGFQTAEFALSHGLIDAVVPREGLRETLANLVALHSVGKRGARAAEEAAPADLSAEGVASTVALAEPCAPLSAGRAISAPAGGEALAAGVPSPRFPTRRARAEAAAGVGDNPAWESVLLARNTHRPTASTYLAGMVDGFIELHGDRSFGDDGAIIAGIGWLGGTPVTVIAQEKGANLKDRIRRNFGCPQPEGYRKSLRLARQAAKFGRPVVCLVDTQGAFCGTEAEERGQGNAIAENLYGLAGLPVPVVSVLIGEGGSGGALALAVADRVAMQRHAVYSVLSPEGFASILWKDRTRAPEAAAVMRIGAEDARELGVVDAVLDEGERPAHENPAQAVAHVCAYVEAALAELSALPVDELLDRRYARFRKF